MKRNKRKSGFKSRLAVLINQEARQKKINSHLIDRRKLSRLSLSSLVQIFHEIRRY